MNIPVSPRHGSHLTTLLKCVMSTDGPVLELGTGLYSTIVLNAALPYDRLLLSFETNAEWFKQLGDLERPGHQLFCLASFDEMYTNIAFMTNGFDVIFIDHAPAERRKTDIAKLANDRSLFVVHDYEHPAYGYDTVNGLFKHILVHDHKIPHTAIMTNNSNYFSRVK